MEKILYKKLIRQYSDDGGLNWKDTDIWKVGEIIESPSNCEGQYVEGCYWKQLPISEGYLCDGVNKHYKLIELCNNNGLMKPSGNNKMGEIYETNSVDCGYLPPTPQYRWVESGTICRSVDKYVKEIEEESLDNGLTWNPTGKERDGKIIQYRSKDCGYIDEYPNKDLVFYFQYQYDFPITYRLNGQTYEDYGHSPIAETLGGLGITTLTDCKETFYGSNIKDLVKFPNTANVTTMERMFWKNNAYLKRVDLSDFDTRNVQNMNEMFRECDNLYYLFGIENFNTQNVTNMRGMFYKDVKITELDLSKWDTKKVQNMEGMFAYCDGLTKLDISGWQTPALTNIRGMFAECKNLEELNVNHLDVSHTTNFDWLFSRCYKLTSLDVSSWNTSNVNSMMDVFNGTRFKTLNLSNWNTINVTDMIGLFAFCTSLTSLDLSRWYTNKVQRMEAMFMSCISLTSIDLSHFKTDSLVNMDSMFSGCKSLTSIDLSHFNTSNVWTLQSMFSGCRSLRELNLSNFDTSKVTTMYELVRDCSSLTSIDLSRWEIIKECKITRMFYGCSALKNIYMRNCSQSTIDKIKNQLSIDLPGQRVEIIT